MAEYQICTRCVMDTTDPEIHFDEKGQCNHCRGFDELVTKRQLTQQKREIILARLVDDIKRSGKGKQYDCIIGVSGGVDSTYVAYLVKKLGLRPLAVHMDNGWDSELSVKNIENILKLLDIDLYTEVLDWEEFRDLQLSFLRASVSDAEIPTDHAIGAVLYRIASQYGITHIINGANMATEAIIPDSWTYGIWDWRYIKSIHNEFGTRPLKLYPHYSYWDRLFYTYIKRIRMVYILDYVEYNKAEAMRIIKDDLGWRYYGGKHYESIYTRFFQGYILPTKFNIDKRKAHLSTLIASGQMKREEALQELGKPAYSGYMQEEDMEYVLKKLELSEAEFEGIMRLPIKNHTDYPNYSTIINFFEHLGVFKLARTLKLKPKVQELG